MTESNEQGGALIGILMALGLLGFFISVVTAGLDNTRTSTERLMADGEFFDVKRYLIGFPACDLPCDAFLKAFPKSLGVWKVSPRCRGGTKQLFVKAAASLKSSKKRYEKYRKWTEIPGKPLQGKLCTVDQRPPAALGH